MAAVVARIPPVLGRSATPPPHLTLNKSARGTPAAVPNKHIPICSPGMRPGRGLDTPPDSPPKKNAVVEIDSVTYPPDAYPKVVDDPVVYSIDAEGLAEAVEHLSTQPLPDPQLMFPWLHGLHPENHLQLAFFVARCRSLRKIPRCYRGITIVKAGGDLSSARLKGAVPPEELLVSPSCPENEATFLDVDPKEGFSVRNFHIQACKVATLSDIIVYGDDDMPKGEVVSLARRISVAQRSFRAKCEASGAPLQTFNTFVVSDMFEVFEQQFPELVVTDSRGNPTNTVTDFFYWERLEMCTMSKASEISNNVWLGPSPDPSLLDSPQDHPIFEVSIECTDIGQAPDPRMLKELRKLFDVPNHPPLQLEFPSSGSIMPPSWSQAEVDGLMEMCKWIYQLANPAAEEPEDSADKDADDDCILMASFPKPKRIFLHCADGYTETSLLALTYFMYAEGLPVHEAWVRLHREKGRNFFAYPSDVALLTSIQPRILQESPRWRGNIMSLSEPQWLSRMDGSLPSRILPYMYLGNLGHANNPELLRELGIRRVLSVGEPVSWPKELLRQWSSENLLFIDRVQDNGVDPLTDEFERCLQFIEQGKCDGTATLVHCRVGVSRSATICIAEVMKELGLSFPRAYCYVRARRLNVIIQPHLRFTYELLKWEEFQCERRNKPLRRELDWATVAREIALMNKPYARQ